MKRRLGDEVPLAEGELPAELAGLGADADPFAGCATWCSSPCVELLGDYKKECAACEGRIKCNPLGGDWEGGGEEGAPSAKDRLREALGRASASRAGHDEV